LDAGSLIITTGTYQRAHIFRTREHLLLFESHMLSGVRDQGWTVLAWAFFSNHYHVIISEIEDGSRLPTVMRRLHGGLSHAINGLQNERGRKVFHNYWDSRFHDDKSFLARMRYVMQNPVHHGLVANAADYPFCSASWFERTAPTSFVKTLETFKTDRVSVPDPFVPVWSAAEAAEPERH